MHPKNMNLCSCGCLLELLKVAWWVCGHFRLLSLGEIGTLKPLSRPLIGPMLTKKLDNLPSGSSVARLWACEWLRKYYLSGNHPGCLASPPMKPVSTAIGQLNILLSSIYSIYLKRIGGS